MTKMFHFCMMGATAVAGTAGLYSLGFPLGISAGIVAAAASIPELVFAVIDADMKACGLGSTAVEAKVLNNKRLADAALQQVTSNLRATTMSTHQVLVVDNRDAQKIAKTLLSINTIREKSLNEINNSSKKI